MHLCLCHYLYLYSTFTFKPCFLSSTFASAASSVMINRMRATPVKLVRSNRQGCPLSPLLFIIAIDVLSECISQDVSSNLIQGVVLPKTNLHQVQNFYADDVDLVIKADLDIMLHCQRLLSSFGHASGLYFDWSKTKAALIPHIPTPPPLLSLGWQWESTKNASKLLGFTSPNRSRKS